MAVTPALPIGAGFVEVGRGVLVARYDEFDVNVGLVVGSAGALIVDTRGSTVHGRAVLGAVSSLGLQVVAVVNTHVHFDHVFGNAAFAGATIHAHDRVAQTFEEAAADAKAAFRADPTGYPERDVADLLASDVRGPDVTFTTTARLDLGDREVVLSHAGRGHTDGDIRIDVPGAGVTFIGDLVEESAPPSLGDDSWPLEWSATLDAHAAALASGSVVVPGHGNPVDVEFIRRQRDEMRSLASVIRERHTAGMPLAEAAKAPDSRLPYPLDRLSSAFARGYAQLDAPRGPEHPDRSV